MHQVSRPSYRHARGADDSARLIDNLGIRSPGVGGWDKATSVGGVRLMIGRVDTNLRFALPYYAEIWHQRSRNL